MNEHFLSLLRNATRLLSARSWVLLLLAVSAIAGLSCTGHGTQYANIPPITRLANLPPPQDTITSSNPRLTLYWVGDDPDGYVVAFKYRWSYPFKGQVQERPWSTILNIGIPKSGSQNFALMLDSTNYTRSEWGQGPSAYNGQQSERYAVAVYKYFATLSPEALSDTALTNPFGRGDTVLIQGVRVYAANPDVQAFPVHVNPNSGTFIFDSQDSLNAHRFEIGAIDNSATVGPMALLSFNTLRVTMPHTQINTSPTDTVLVLDHFTDTFTGIAFTFGMIDPNSRTKQYSWNVDSIQKDGTLRWSDWTDNTSAFVTAADFAPSRKYDMDHVFSVRSRNEFGSIDTAGFFANIVIGSGNNPQSLTGAVVIGLDSDGPNRPIAGTYTLTASAGTNPGTMKYTYNNGVPVDNVLPLTQNVVVHGGVAGLLSINTQLRPASLPQSDPVAVVVASAKFYTIYPKFARDPNYHRYLVISGSFEWSPGGVTKNHPSRQMIMDFYDSLFHAIGKTGAYDKWDMHPKLSDTDKTAFPTEGQLSNYSMVFITCDSDSGLSATQGTPLGAYGKTHQTDWGITKEHAGLLQSYCYIGGKLVISAKNFFGPLNSEATTARLLHFNTNGAGLPGTGGPYGEIYDDFAGASGDTTKGYPDAILDHEKLDTTHCSAGALNDVWSIEPIGFGERLYRYETSGCDTAMVPYWYTNGSQYFSGKTVGIRYQGVTYSVIYYGFPLYYCQYDNAVAIVRNTLIDIGEF